MNQVQRKKSSVADTRYTEGFNDAILRFRSMIHSAPPIEAVQVVHAYWMGGNYCSNCHATRSRPWAEYLEQNANTFCHVCGARMDAKEGLSCE